MNPYQPVRDRLGFQQDLDDAARADEREIVQLWRSQYPKTEHEYIETERGCSVLTIHRSLRKNARR